MGHDGEVALPIPLAPGRSKVRPWLEVALWLALLIVPVVVGLAWGTYFDDGVYATFRCARNLAAGRGPDDYPAPGPALSAVEGPAQSEVEGLVQSAVEGWQTLLRAPVYVVALALLAWVGMPLLEAGLVLSGLGWGATAVAVYGTGRGMRRPVAGVVAATLVAFSPVIVTTLGSGVSWAVAWAWIALGASVRKRWCVQTWALVLMLCTRFDVSTLALAGALVIVQWSERQRFPVWSGLVWALAVLGWGLIATVQPRLFPSLVIGYWPSFIDHGSQGIRRLLDESEFYWLFVPLCVGGVGLLLKTRKARWYGVLWGACMVVAVLSGGEAAGGLMVTLGLFLAGLGVAGAIRWVGARDVVRLDRRTLAVSLALVCGLPLGVAQASTLVERYRLRPVVRQELEQQAGDWLRAHSEPAATVLGSERVGYLAERRTLAWDGDGGDQAALTSLLKPLVKNPATYCVSFGSLAWDHLVRTGWFRESYVPLQTFESPYDAASPFTVWGYRFDALARPVGANFGNQIGLLSLGAADSVSPGAEFDVRLYWEALQSPEDDYTVFVHLLDAAGQLVAGHDGPPMDGQSPTRAWLPGEIVTDVHRIVLDPNLSVGTYRLQVGMYRWPSVERLPVWDSQGVEQADRVLVLQPVQVR